MHLYCAPDVPQVPARVAALSSSLSVLGGWCCLLLFWLVQVSLVRARGRARVRARALGLGLGLGSDPSPTPTPTFWRVQVDGFGAPPTVCVGGCNRMCWRLQPYVLEAATLFPLQVDGFGAPPTRDSRWLFYLPKVALVPQHGQSARLGSAQLSSFASSGRAWRLRAARDNPGERSGPWAPSHCLRCSSQPPRTPPIPPPFDHVGAEHVGGSICRAVPARRSQLVLAAPA